MDRKVLKMATAVILVLTFLIPCTIRRMPDMHEQYALAEEIRSAPILQTHVKASVAPENVVKESNTLNGQLKIEIPQGIDGSGIKVSEDYLTQTIYIKVATDVRDYFSEYDISGSSDKIASLQYYNEGGNGVIAISMNRLYEITYKLENGALYTDFIDPHDIYDKVIVIDAGHGSRMSGATKNGIQEKDINLDIVLQLKALFDAYDGNIGVYYTRTDDSNPTLQQRAELANKAGADLFISVHNNSSGTGNFTSVNGTQVLYSESDDRELGSKKLAQICLDNVTAATGSNDFGLLKADDIYIVRSSEAPVALIEVGFMTNRDELAKLADPEYQKTAAQGIFNAVLEAVKEGY